MWLERKWEENVQIVIGKSLSIYSVQVFWESAVMFLGIFFWGGNSWLWNYLQIEVIFGRDLIVFSFEELIIQWRKWGTDIVESVWAAKLEAVKALWRTSRLSLCSDYDLIWINILEVYFNGFLECLLNFTGSGIRVTYVHWHLKFSMTSSEDRWCLCAFTQAW